MKIQQFFLAVLLGLGAGMSTAAAAAAGAPPAAVFFDNDKFAGAVLSPDGRLLAVKMGSTEGKRIGLGVINLADMNVRPVVLFDDTDVRQVRWVNNERLVFDTIDRATADGLRAYAPGLFSVKADGSGMRQLADRSHGVGYFWSDGRNDAKVLPWHTYLTEEPGAQDSDEIYVRNIAFHADSSRRVSLLKLNVVSGRTQNVVGPKATVQRYLFDHRGEPRLAIGLDGGKSTVHLRDPASGEWRELASQAAYRMGEGDYMPEGFGPDGTLYVSAYHADKLALFKLNLDSGKLSDQPAVVMTDFDFDGKLVISGGKLLGIDYLGESEGTVWLDKRMQDIQADVDAKLPHTVNRISIGARQAAPWVLVRAYSDIMPDTYLLYNTDTRSFTKVAESRPQVNPAQMATLQMVKVKARDGLEIPTWITTPRGNAKKLPMVVLVHGGPYVRGVEWAWSPESQFLASRGYLVVEPEFRGSTGYGKQLMDAGFKQWGLKMQDDIADAARWAIANGMADPERVCIAGASYGGYATLMGLVRDPGLYRCGINWVGVTDIELMYTGTFLDDSDLPPSWKQFGMPELIGDRVKDAQQLRDTSPLAQAAKITRPLLLAYGGADKRVPIFHGKKFLDAVKQHNRQVEWIEYPAEGHGWFLPENQVDFWTRVEKFLEKHIGAKP